MFEAVPERRSAPLTVAVSGAVVMVAVGVVVSTAYVVATDVREIIAKSATIMNFLNIYKTKHCT